MKKLIICDGGIGDSIILIGACQDLVDVAIRDAQRPLISQLTNVNKTFDVHSPEFKNLDLDEEYDKVIRSDMFLANYDKLYKFDYYELAAKRLNQNKPSIGSFRIQVDPIQQTLAIHTTATNPNRHIPKNVWDEVAYSASKAGWHVYFLGTSGDYGFTDKVNHIYKVSDWTEDLLEQTQLLATCSRFVGIDSGFIHISGVLGVESSCILTNTGYNVIQRYPTVLGIENFDELGLQPTHSLQPYCPVSKALAESITADQICEFLGISHCQSYTKTDTSRKIKVKISNDADNTLPDYLDGFQIVDDEEDVHLILVKDLMVEIHIGDFKDLFMSHYLNLPRGIRNAWYTAGKDSNA